MTPNAKILPALLLVTQGINPANVDASTPPAVEAPAANAQKHFDNIRVKMRDGITLSTNVFLPEQSGPVPVMLIRTPYNASTSTSESAKEWTDHGYAVVYQDVRGRFRSEGEDIPWTAETLDAEDVLNWLVKQPWCNGKVGMYGGSYLGFTQVAASRTGHPALRMTTPTLIGADRYHTSYWGGALRHGRLSRWLLRSPVKAHDSDLEALDGHLPLSTLDTFMCGKEIPYWHDVLAHPAYDDFWKKQALSNDLGKIQAPAFIRTGWFDLFICDAFDLYNGIHQKAGSETARKNTRMIVGPWPHDINKIDFCEADFGAKAQLLDLFKEEVAYAGKFLKDDAKADISAAPIRLFVMGANEWRDEYEWPLARTQWTKFYLASGGKANTGKGDGKLASAASGSADRFNYDPSNPVPTNGGAWCFVNLGLRDQQELEKREDILVYTSEPLKAPTEVTGPITAELYISSSAPDTDFTVKLVDVAPDGKAMGITDGIVRARYRNQVPEGELLKQGEVYRVTIKCPPTSYLFKEGHRIRVDVSSSNFPVFARNLNSGLLPSEEKDPIVARQTIYHTEEYPSHIVLPIIPQNTKAPSAPSGKKRN